jgi:glycosyltransferase involved in cell wall biosynthesis
MVHTIARIALADGGPSRTVVALCRSLAKEGARVELLAGDVDGSEMGVPVHVSGTIRRWGRAQPQPARFARLLEERLAVSRPVVIHDHGIWLASNHKVATVARRARVPRIVSPRGMLSEWALAYRGWKKRIAWRSFQHRDLRSADALHATSELEAEEIRAAGVGVPIAIVPNGVDLPPFPGPRQSGSERPRRFLFLSRIHPKKGLENLIEAWGQVRPEGWELVIAGPDENGHRAQIERRAGKLGPGAEVRFFDPVPDGEKWDLYDSADVFVLPTLSENFGVVVAEALASAVPVITTRAAPWAVLSERGCGWWAEVGVEPLARAIREAAAISDAERREMGVRGRRVVEERFAWPAIARQMLFVYRWLAGEAGEPDCIRRG